MRSLDSTYASGSHGLSIMCRPLYGTVDWAEAIDANEATTITALSAIVARASCPRARRASGPLECGSSRKCEGGTPSPREDSVRRAGCARAANERVRAVWLAIGSGDRQRDSAEEQ